MSHSGGLGPKIDQYFDHYIIRCFLSFFKALEFYYLFTFDKLLLQHVIMIWNKNAGTVDTFARKQYLPATKTKVLLNLKA